MQGAWPATSTAHPEAMKLLSSQGVKTMGKIQKSLAAASGNQPDSFDTNEVPTENEVSALDEMSAEDEAAIFGPSDLKFEIKWAISPPPEAELD